MNKISHTLIPLTPLVFFVFAGIIQPLPAESQGIGENSQELLEQETHESEESIEQFEQEREEREEELEGTLNIEEKDPNKPRLEGVQDPNEELGLDDNLPEGDVDDEAEVKF